MGIYAQKFLQNTERTFGNGELIVSKTDLKGRITYANDVFLRLASLTESEALGAPHSVIRHPFMPRSVFKLLWDKIETKKEIFAYVVNRSKNGDYYWVLAHVTPSYDTNGTVIGYHSNRRVPQKRIIDQTIIPLYETLLGIEESLPNAKEGMNKAFSTLTDILNRQGKSYEEFIFSL